MNYEVYINPCKACSIKYENEGCPINSMNNCVFETTAAFAGVPSLNAISVEGSDSGEKCIANIRNKMGPFPGWYKNRKIAKPAIFIQAPHYVPQLLQKGHDVESARNMCIRMCNGNGECIDNCNTDANAVVSIQPKMCNDTSNYVSENFEDNFDAMQAHYSKPIELNIPYYESLRLAKPYIYTSMGVPPGGNLSNIQLLHYAIPALNTDIRFTKVLSSFEISDHPGLAAIDVKNIPTNFNWRTVTENDNDVIKNKKALISSPGDQGLCGSCWAISVANAASDVFVVSGLVDYKPELSTTWALACYPQDQCDGGNPAILVEDIAKKGIASDHCIDYSWCLNNPTCNTNNPSQQFSPETELNNLIPKCGCYEKNSEHYLYFLEPNSQTLYAKPDNNSIENTRNIVKKQILLNGPVIGGFVVFNNFMKNKGHFTKVNGGIYLENGVYDDTNTIKFSNDQTNSSNYIGSHAIAIIGWGIENNIIIDNKGNKANVPYWYCRNSWGDSWGENGYFKMAMYPYNKTSQFDILVKFKTDVSVEEAGGIILMKATKKPVQKTLNQINDIYLKNIKKVKDDSYYLSDTVEKFSCSSPSGQKNDNTLLFIIMFILVILAVFFIIKHLKS